MKRLLVNGCSYAHSWGDYARLLGERLGFDETVNLGRPGGSNERSFRTTQNYILENQVDFVILMLTFWDRTESPWFKSIPIEGPWGSYSSIFNPAYHLRGRTLKFGDAELYKKYILDRVKYDLTEDRCDKLYTELIFFTGWLKSRNIPYCIFGACDMDYHPEHVPEFKVNAVKNDPCIIDILNWSSNKFLFENGATCLPADEKIDPVYKHFMPDSHGPLNDFLYNFITKNCQ